MGRGDRPNAPSRRGIGRRDRQRPLAGQRARAVERAAAGLGLAEREEQPRLQHGRIEILGGEAVELAGHRHRAAQLVARDQVVGIGDRDLGQIERHVLPVGVAERLRVERVGRGHASFGEGLLGLRERELDADRAVGRCLGPGAEAFDAGGRVAAAAEPALRAQRDRPGLGLCVLEFRAERLVKHRRDQRQRLLGLVARQRQPGAFDRDQRRRARLACRIDRACKLAEQAVGLAPAADVEQGLRAAQLDQMRRVDRQRPGQQGHAAFARGERGARLQQRAMRDDLVGQRGRQLVRHAEALELIGRALETRQRGVGMVAHAVERAFVELDLGQAERIAGQLHRDACLREIGQRVVVAFEQAARDAAAHMRLADQDRIAAALEQRQRIAGVLLGLRDLAEPHVHGAEPADDACAQQRKGLGRQIVEQARQHLAGFLVAAGHEIDLGFAQTQLRRRAQRGRRGRDQALRVFEIVDQQSGVDPRQPLFLGRPGSGRGRGRCRRAERRGEQVGGDPCRRHRLVGACREAAHGAAAFAQIEIDRPAGVGAAQPRGDLPARRQCAFDPLGQLAGGRVVAQHRHHVLARRDALAGLAQAAGDELHDAEPQPGPLGRRIDRGRQDRDQVVGLHRSAGRAAAHGRRRRRRRRAVPQPQCGERDADQHEHRDRERGPTARGTQRCGRRRHRRFRHGHGRIGERRRVRSRRGSRHRFGRRRLGGLLARHDLGDPAVAEAGYRADRLLRLAGVADRAPRLQHDLGQLGVSDVGLAPDRGHQLVAADRAVAVLDQIGQAVEHARRQRTQAAVLGQLARRKIDQMGTETQPSCHRGEGKRRVRA
ncbi:MAG: hypothetical protein DI564_08840 [Rhodanobacter denitrificans]|uniref:Uncharacterized protein n=1 Tax=Rhodanobacter denitrificans TaxID=666685 RepID=A0A2W5KIY8_9GAMM|nr:MAG: hypothetical protein DI564_08840 [Rhodanobacter denitrificans]